MKTLIKKGYCTGCGVCISESCSKKMKMSFNKYGFLIPININNSDIGSCLKVCPFNPEPEEFVENEDVLAKQFFPTANFSDHKIGLFENTYIGYSPEYRDTSSSGGIATYVFEQLLEKNIVDRLYIVKEHEGRYQYQFFDNKNEITKISKTKYYPVTMEDLFLEIDKLEGKVAVSGVGCFIKAIRLKQAYYPVYKEKIPFLVGIICGGLKSSFFSDFLANSAGVQGEYDHPLFRVKDLNSDASDYSFGCYAKTTRNYHELKMRSVGDMWGTGYFKSNACDFCTDVTTELADISLGDAWLNEYIQDGAGTSVIITRSKLADQIIQDGIDSKKLNVETEPKEKIIQSQFGSFTHRQDAIKFRAWITLSSKHNMPHFRTRFKRFISPTYMCVQIVRRITRKKSLILWYKLGSSKKFKNHMKKYLILLKLVTKVDHLTRKMKRILFKQ